MTLFKRAERGSLRAVTVVAFTSGGLCDLVQAASRRSFEGGDLFDGALQCAGCPGRGRVVRLHQEPGRLAQASVRLSARQTDD